MDFIYFAICRSYDPMQRNGLAIALGLACGQSGSHLDMVLQTIGKVIERIQSLNNRDGLEAVVKEGKTSVMQ